jgi:ABC-type branched-subunit amino acid transport system substrate-binding protein
MQRVAAYRPSGAGLIVAAFLLAGCVKQADDFGAPVIGVELPFAGRDAADGLQARNGIELALGDWNATHRRFVRARYRDSGMHLQNPHEDEGQDPVGEADRAASIAQDFVRDDAVLGVIGGLRPEVVRAEARYTGPAGLALVSGGAAHETGGAVFAAFDVAGLSGDRVFLAHYRRRAMEAASPEALRFYAATALMLEAFARSDGTRSGVLTALGARCRGGICPTPTALPGVE